MLNVDKLSYWERKSIFENTDYLIIGSGIVGYSTALHLREINPESRILIVERGYLPSGASSKNAGFACFGSATEIYDDISTFGEDLVWETVSLRWQGLSYLRKLVGDDHLKLEINGSWDLITANEMQLFEEVAGQLPYFNEKLKEITGEKDVYSIDNTIRSAFGLEKILTSIKNRLEGQIDTGSMNQRFYELAVSKGINVLFGVEAERIMKGTVFTNIGNLKAKKIAICTNGFARTFLPNEDVQPARAQVVVTSPIEGLQIKGTFHYQMGYYYFRNIDGRILFGGGRNLNFEAETTEKMENTAEITNKLEELLETVILPGKKYEIDYQWAGIMGVGRDKKPIIKEIDTNLYCGVRLGGMGVAIGTLVGKELAELMNP